MSTPQNRIRAALLFALLTLAAIATPAEAASWSTVPTLAPEGFSESALAGVSCTSASFCMAVGTADDNGAEFKTPANVGAFSEIWDGSSWRVVPTADPAGAGSGLLSVSCVSPSFCVAVGATPSEGDVFLMSPYHGGARALVEVWNGLAWSIEPTPAGGRPNSGLEGVTCLSVSFCVAVGSSAPGHTSAGNAMVETWNGKAWKLRQTPFVARYGSPLLGISCSSPSSCTAVGLYNANPHTGVPENEALAEHWNGRRWSVAHPPGGGHYFPSLAAVACPGGAECIAVGHYLTSQNITAAGPLVERWRGGRWRRITAGLPKYGFLRGISCIAVDRCIAVGRLDRGFWLTSDKTSPLILSWNGSRWAREPAPSVPAPKTKEGTADSIAPALLGLSCPAQGGCTAVGVQGLAGTYAPLVQGTTESLAEPTPALPAPRITAGPGATTTSRTARLEFESGTAGVGFECRLGSDGVGAALSGWAPCSSPLSYSHLKPGQKRFSVRAVLGAGRSAAASREWTILEPGAPRPLVLPVVGHRASFHATCPLAERCHERVVVKAGGKELARGAYSIPAHADRQVEIGLTATGERLLADRSQLAATLVLENLHTHRRAEVAVLLERR